MAAIKGQLEPATFQLDFGKMINRYLSIEEQRAFWTELFAVTIRYEQRRGGAMEECLDLFSGQEQPTGCHTNAGLTRKNHALKKSGS